MNSLESNFLRQNEQSNYWFQKDFFLLKYVLRKSRNVVTALWKKQAKYCSTGNQWSPDQQPAQCNWRCVGTRVENSLHQEDNNKWVARRIIVDQIFRKNSSRENIAVLWREVLVGSFGSHKVSLSDLKIHIASWKSYPPKFDFDLMNLNN